MGGTTWAKVIQDVQGINLTKYQQHLGNQWDPFIDCQPPIDYLVISIGGNDVDQYCCRPSKHDNKEGRPLHNVQFRRDLNCKFNVITKDVLKVLDFLSSNIMVRQIYYAKIMPRHWCPLVSISERSGHVTYSIPIITSMNEYPTVC